MRFFNALPSMQGVTMELTRREYELIIYGLNELQEDPHADLLNKLRDTLQQESVVDVKKEILIVPMSFTNLSQLGELLFKVLNRSRMIQDPRIWKGLLKSAKRKINLFSGDMLTTSDRGPEGAE